MNAVAIGIFIVACIVLVAVPVHFIFHEVYEDGLVGRLGLAGVAFTAAMSLGQWLVSLVDGDPSTFAVSNLTVLMTSGFAVFLCWHLFRFHRRVLRKRSTAQ